MEVLRRFWNIFQTIMDSLGSAEFESAESEDAVFNLFKRILVTLNFAVPIVSMIMNFIYFAFKVYKLIRSLMNRSQPLGY